MNPEAAPLLQAIEAAANATQLADAVKALAEAQIPATAPDLIRALNYNNPGAAVAAVDGLIAIGEPAVIPLLELLDNHNYGARAWALRALSGIGDPRSLDLLLDTAKNDFALSVRRAAARGLGFIHWELMAPDAVGAAQAQCLAVLMGLGEDPEWVVRYSAISAIEAIGLNNIDLRASTIAHLQQIQNQDAEMGVRARAQLAVSRIESLPFDPSQTQP